MPRPSLGGMCRKVLIWMRKYRVLRNAGVGAAILLSDLMCAVVAYGWCELEWGGRYEGWSFPAWAAGLYAIPFAVGIAVCVALALYFHRKVKDSGS